MCTADSKPQYGSTQISHRFPHTGEHGAMLITLASPPLPGQSRQNRRRNCTTDDMHSLCITAWTGSAALLSLGLTVGMTIGVGLVAKFFMVVLALSNGWLGAEWHVGFTVAQRFVSASQTRMSMVSLTKN